MKLQKEPTRQKRIKMKKLFLVLLLLCLCVGCQAEELVTFTDPDIASDDLFVFTDDISDNWTEKLSTANKVTFGGCEVEYFIDVEGFKSLTVDEAMKISALIQLLSSGIYFDTDLGTAVYETFLPERFRVGYEEELVTEEYYVGDIYVGPIQPRDNAVYYKMETSSIANCENVYVDVDSVENIYLTFGLKNYKLSLVGDWTETER